MQLTTESVLLGQTASQLEKNSAGLDSPLEKQSSKHVFYNGQERKLKLGCLWKNKPAAQNSFEYRSQQYSVDFKNCNYTVNFKAVYLGVFHLISATIP